VVDLTEPVSSHRVTAPAAEALYQATGSVEREAAERRATVTKIGLSGERKIARSHALQPTRKNRETKTTYKNENVARSCDDAYD